MAFFPAFAELDPGKMGVKAAAPFLSQPVPDLSLIHIYLFGRPVPGEEFDRLC